MAKKEATKFSYGVFDRKHIASIKKRLKAIDDLFDAAITQGARIGETSGFKDPDKPFYISDYPAVQERINDLMRSVGRGLQGVIETGDREEWLLSCEKNDAMVDAITSSTRATERRNFAMETAKFGGFIIIPAPQGSRDDAFRPGLEHYGTIQAGTGTCS